MRADVRPVNDRGRPLFKAVRLKQAASRGELRLAENRLHSLGRVVLSATLTDDAGGTGTALLPELLDAQVIWIDGTTMRLRGVETIDGVSYAQTWDVTVLVK